MAATAIAFLWLIIGVILVGGAIYLLLWVLETFFNVQLPPKLVQGIWLIFGLLVLIYVISVLLGGGHPFPALK